jgi:hypothetical protein
MQPSPDTFLGADMLYRRNESLPNQIKCKSDANFDGLPLAICFTYVIHRLMKLLACQK